MALTIAHHALARVDGQQYATRSHGKSDASTSGAVWALPHVVIPFRGPLAGGAR